MQDLDFNILPSRQFFLLSVVIFLITGSYIALSALPLGVKLASLFALLTYGGFLSWQTGAKDKILSIRWRMDGQFFVQIGECYYPAEPLGDSLVTNYITVLNLKVNGKRRKCVLCKDALKDYRRFMVCLRAN